MKIVEHNFKMAGQVPTYEKALEICENRARICYRSEPKGNAEGFIKRIIKIGHESVLEHVQIGVDVTTDVGISHEWVRHRVGCSYSQESSRWCNYAKGAFGGEIKVVKPVNLKYGTTEYNIWEQAMRNCEAAYINMTEFGVSAQIARSVLPKSLATVIGITMNIRAWRHFFQLRTTKNAHPDMQYIAWKILNHFQNTYPVFFEDL